MPFYKYRGTDSAGKPITGSLDAVSPESAKQRLMAMGLGSVVVEVGSAAPAPAPAPAPPSSSLRTPTSKPVQPRSTANRVAPSAPRPAPSPASRPAPRPQGSAQAPGQAAGHGGVPSVPSVGAQGGYPGASSQFSTPYASSFADGVADGTASAHDGWGASYGGSGRSESPTLDDDFDGAPLQVPIAGNRKRSFFFDQIQRFLRAGMAPGTFLETLGNQEGGRNGEFLRNGAKLSASGRTMAASLQGGFITEPERSTILAGERGGYLPDAAEALAKVAMDGFRFARVGAYPMLLMLFAIFCSTCNRAVQNAAIRSMERQDAAGGSLPPATTIAQEIGVRLPAAMAWGSLWVFGLVTVWAIWMMPFNRFRRHAIVAKLPLFSSRNQSEAVTMFTWNLAELSRAGISASESLRLAAGTIPNLYMRKQMREQVARSPIGTPLSHTLRGNAMLSPSAVHIIENGEIAGDVPGALQSVSTAEASQFEFKQKSSRLGIYTAMQVIIALIVLWLVREAYVYWYTEIFKFFGRAE